MYPTPGLLIRAVLLAGAVWLIIRMAERFHSDLDRLRSKYRDFKTRDDAEVLRRMERPQRRKNYQETCVMEFRAEAIAMGLLWGLTVLAGIYALATVIGIIRGIASAF